MLTREKQQTEDQQSQDDEDTQPAPLFLVENSQQQREKIEAAKDKHNIHDQPSFPSTHQPPSLLNHITNRPAHNPSTANHHSKHPSPPIISQTPLDPKTTNPPHEEHGQRRQVCEEALGERIEDRRQEKGRGSEERQGGKGEFTARVWEGETETRRQRLREEKGASEVEEKASQQGVNARGN
ncbi:hypothetical protein Droror1_Dr00026114 [Drosera rotundifolia]